MSIEELVLGSDPLPESDVSITLGIFSEEGPTRGRDLAQKKVLEGKVTFNPERCLIYKIPQGESITPQPIIMPDRTRWDLYLIMVPFTLHRAPGNNYYKELT